MPKEITPMGDLTCEYCQQCEAYHSCFSGYHGFSTSSTNYGRSQKSCASHAKGCGVKHYDHQTELGDYIE